MRQSNQTLKQQVEMVLSQHAELRMKQRGIRLETIRDVMRLADVDLTAGDGCRVYRISSARMAALLREGAQVGRLDRAIGVIVVWSEWSSEVVTVLHDYGRRGRWYRWRGKR